MKTALFLLLLAPSLLALDISTLDGKVYRDCRVSQTLPDSICVLFSGGGARIKFANLPESTREKFGYDAQKASSFESAEAAREQQQRITLEAQRQQQQQAQQHHSAETRTPRANGSLLPTTGGGSTGGYYGAQTAGGGNYNQGGNQFGGGFRRGGSVYVGVNMAAPGGIYGITYGPTRGRP